jgi:hypothetical protein
MVTSPLGEYSISSPQGPDQGVLNRHPPISKSIDEHLRGRAQQGGDSRKGGPCSLGYSPALTIGDMCRGGKLTFGPLPAKSEHCPNSARRGATRSCIRATPANTRRGPLCTQGEDSAEDAIRVHLLPKDGPSLFI